LGAETNAYGNGAAKKSKGCEWDIEHLKSKEQYQKIFTEQGLKAALEWRDSRFAPTAEAGMRARKIEK